MENTDVLFFLLSHRSEYKQMLKQRKHSPFDDQSSPDGSQYHSKYLINRN